MIFLLSIYNDLCVLIAMIYALCSKRVHFHVFFIYFYEFHRIFICLAMKTKKYHICQTEQCRREISDFITMKLSICSEKNLAKSKLVCAVFLAEKCQHLFENLLSSPRFYKQKREALCSHSRNEA